MLHDVFWVFTVTPDCVLQSVGLDERWKLAEGPSVVDWWMVLLLLPVFARTRMSLMDLFLRKATRGGSGNGCFKFGWSVVMRLYNVCISLGRNFKRGCHLTDRTTLGLSLVDSTCLLVFGWRNDSLSVLPISVAILLSASCLKPRLKKKLTNSLAFLW